MLILRILVLLLLLLANTLANCQSRWGLSYDASRLYVHTENISFDAAKQGHGIMLSYGRHTNPQNESYSKRGLPIVGLNIYYTDFGIKGVGDAFGFFPSVSFEHRLAERWHLETILGVGLGYATKYYSRQPWEDTTYNAIGSHFNNFTRLSENLFYTLNNGNQISLSLALAHVSSSASSAPNYGINAGSLGIGYHMTEEASPKYGKPIEAHPAATRNAVQMGYAFTTDKRAVGLTFPIYTISYKHYWINKASLAAWLLGAEIIHNSKNRDILHWRDMRYNKPKFSQDLQYYLMVGREWYIGDFGVCLLVDLGYNSSTRKFDHLEKPTLFYYPFNTDYSTQSAWRNIYLGMGLCTKMANAQYLDFSLGTYF